MQDGPCKPHYYKKRLKNNTREKVYKRVRESVKTCQLEKKVEKWTLNELLHMLLVTTLVNIPLNQKVENKEREKKEGYKRGN